MGGWTPGAAVRRVRKVFAAALQASAAAGLAWWFAHEVLGHAQPFFAPIAAAVALSTSHVQRARRSVQMIVGVTLGIGVAELLHPLLGNGALSIAVILLVTLLVAVSVGIGFVGEGMMFVNQAAASAILVVALHRTGTGAERLTDALVGGAFALIIGVGLFPADPLRLLWAAELRVLRSLTLLVERDPTPRADPVMDRALAASLEVHTRLSELTAARSTARASVRVAPRRMPLRGRVDQEERRVARLYLLASGVMSLMRILEEEARAGAGPSAACVAEVAELAAAMRSLLDATRPWTGAGLAELRVNLAELTARAAPQGAPGDVILATGVRRVAGELLGLLPG